MKRYLGLLTLWMSAAACAHAHLQQSIPAEGSVLTQPPSRFDLTFNEAATLTALSLQKEGQPVQKIAGLPTKPSAQFNIPAPRLDAGSYTLTFRALSEDSHVVLGSIRFKIGE